MEEVFRQRLEWGNRCVKKVRRRRDDEEPQFLREGVHVCLRSRKALTLRVGPGREKRRGQISVSKITPPLITSIKDSFLLEKTKGILSRIK